MSSNVHQTTGCGSRFKFQLRLAHPPDSTYRNGSIAFYVISWLVFLVGLWLIGREYYDSIKKYTTLKFYHESVVEGTKKVAAKVLEKQEREKQ